MKAIIIFLIGLFLVNNSTAQTSSKTPLQVDKPIGNFSLNDVCYYRKKSVTNNDFKGKWLMLDFWNQSCTVCVNSMPKTELLQRRFDDKLKIFMVGYTGSQYHPLDRKPDEKSIKKLFSRIRKVSNITIPAAFDSTLFHKYDITGCPFIVIVNPNGIVKAITTHIIAEQIDSLQQNLTVHLSAAYTQSETRQLRLKQRKLNP
jgi:thiol-disulfide isomerase/thioredoxin